MHPNELIARTFAAQFDPPLTVVKTQKVDQKPIPDAYTCSAWDKDRKLGVTAIASGGNLKAYLEAAGPGEIAESAGKAMAEVMGRLAK
jgi:hypothetical protein